MPWFRLCPQPCPTLWTAFGTVCIGPLLISARRVMFAELADSGVVLSVVRGV